MKKKPTTKKKKRSPLSRKDSHSNNQLPPKPRLSEKAKRMVDRAFERTMDQYGATIINLHDA